MIFHTNVTATIHRSSLLLPFLKSSLLLLKFQTRTRTSRKRCHVIWQTDTNVAQETAASIYSSQHPVKCFPWHCLLPISSSQNHQSHLLWYWHFFLSLFSAQQILSLNYSPGFSLKSLFLETTTLILLPWKWRQLVPHKHWHLSIKLHSIIPQDSNADIHWCENL